MYYSVNANESRTNTTVTIRANQPEANPHCDGNTNTITGIAEHSNANRGYNGVNSRGMPYILKIYTSPSNHAKD